MNATRTLGFLEMLDDASSHKVKRIEVHSWPTPELPGSWRRAEHWFVVSGIAAVTLDSDNVELRAGQALDIPRNSAHRIANVGDEPLVFIEVQHGELLRRGRHRALRR